MSDDIAMSDDKAQSGPHPHLPPEDQALALHREALRQRFPLPEPTPRKPRKAKVIAALLVLALAGGYWADPAYQREQYVTDYGERKALELADGSHLTLDSNTRLTVSWHVRSRRVELHQGQALFDISHTWTRPFQVRSGQVEINVLGTLFNVTRTLPSVRVTLLRGSVDVRSQQQAVHLAPGEQVEARGGQLQSVVTADTQAATSWQANRLVFDRMPLGEVLEVVQRYRRAPIRLDDQSLAGLPITGVFDSGNVETLLKLLPSILPVAVAKDADGVLHIRRRPQAK